MILSWGWMCPLPEVTWPCLETFLVAAGRAGVLLACSRWRPGILLNIWDAQDSLSQQRIIWPRMSMSFKLRNLALISKKCHFWSSQFSLFSSSILQEVNGAYKFQRAGLTSLIISSYTYSFNHTLIQYFLALIGIKSHHVLGWSIIYCPNLDTIEHC